MKKLMTVLFAMLMLFGSAGMASAVSLTYLIANPSFENPVLSPGGITSSPIDPPGNWAADDPRNSVPGWNVTSLNNWGTYAGIYNNTGQAPYGGIAPDGNNIAYINLPYSYDYVILSQWVNSATITEGATYTLFADVGARAGLNSDNGTWWLQLYALAPDLVTQQWVTQSYGNPSIDIFTTQSVSYLADSTYAGWTLGVALVAMANGTEFYQINFDNVRLEAETVPEPGTIFLLGSGLVGVWIFARRKFRK